MVQGSEMVAYELVRGLGCRLSHGTGAVSGDGSAMKLKEFLCAFTLAKKVVPQQHNKGTSHLMIFRFPSVTAPYHSRTAGGARFKIVTA